MNKVKICLYGLEHSEEKTRKETRDKFIPLLFLYMDTKTIQTM